MRFDTWTYRQKNRALLPGVVVLVLLAWVLSFSKTYTQIKEYRQLSRLQQQSLGAFSDREHLGQKEAKLDSLIEHFTVDSVAFEDSFLQNISLALQNVPVRVSYEGIETSNDPLITHKEISLQGNYITIVRAIRQLEELYYIERCQLLKEGRCLVNVIMVRR